MGEGAGGSGAEFDKVGLVFLVTRGDEAVDFAFELDLFCLVSMKVLIRAEIFAHLHRCMAHTT